MSFKLNDKGGLDFSSGGLVLLRGKARIAQAAENYLKTLRGEMVHRQQAGMPYLDMRHGGAHELARLRVYFERRLAQFKNETAGVLSAELVEFELKGDSLRYVCNIDTDDGLEVVSGVI